MQEATAGFDGSKEPGPPSLVGIHARASLPRVDVVRADVADVAQDRVYLAMLERAGPETETPQPSPTPTAAINPAVAVPPASPARTLRLGPKIAGHCLDAAHLADRAHRVRAALDLVASRLKVKVDAERFVPLEQGFSISVPAHALEARGAFAIGFASATLVGVVMFLALVQHH